MIIPILISFLVGAAGGFTGQVLADKVKKADRTIVCVTPGKSGKPKCAKVEEKEVK